MARNLEIIIGTYEDFLVGYKIHEIKDDSCSMIQSFATRSHTASVKCIASNGRYIASGGADDRIFVYDMKSRREIQVLMHHDGTVNAVAFTPDGSHILSGSDDGQMIAVRTNSWQIDAKWKKAHSGSPVTHISCHPSGKLALTLGKDVTLRTWNLIKGRTVYTTNLKSKKSLGNMPDCVAWSTNGDYFTLTGPNIIEIWSIQTAGMIKDEKCDSKPISVCWISNDYVLFGLENGKIMMSSVKENEKAKLFDAHEKRVKCMALFSDILATASSSGEISVWTVNIEKQEINKITSSNIGCRPTCIQLLDISEFNGDENEVKEEEEELEINEKAQNIKNERNFGYVKIEYEDNDDIEQSKIEQKCNSESENSLEKYTIERNNTKVKRYDEIKDKEINEEVPKKKKKQLKTSNSHSVRKDKHRPLVSLIQRSDSDNSSSEDEFNKINYVSIIKKNKSSGKRKLKKKKIKT